MPGTRLQEHKAAIRKDTQQQYDKRPNQSRVAYAVRAGGAKAAAANVKASVQSGRQYKCEHCAHPDTNEQCAASGHKLIIVDYGLLIIDYWLQD